MIYAWLTNAQLQKFSTCSDREVLKAYTDVCMLVSYFYIEEHIYSIKRIFRLPEVRTMYTLYRSIKHAQVETIIFFPGVTAVDKLTILAYLNGMIAGLMS